MEKNIMLFTTTLDSGGVATYFRRMEKALNKYNFQSKLIYFKDNISNFKYSEKRTYMNDIKYIKKNILKESPNIIITNNGVETLMCKIAILLSRKKVRLISVIHTRSSMWIPKYKNKIKRFIFEKLVKLSFKVCDKCIAVSEGLKKEVIDEGWISEDRIKTIYNPVIKDDYIGNTKSIENKKVIKIGTIGWIYDVKNQLEAVRAMAKLKNENYELHIIGGIKDREYYEKIKEEVDDLGLKNQVFFEGIKEKIFHELDTLDLIVLTSKMEALPTVIIEAMASGTPVIASNCKFGPEELIEEENGLIYELGNVEELVKKIKLLAENQVLYKKISEEGIKKAEIFKYKNIIERYKEVMR